MDLLLAPEARPFAIAALILIGLIGVEMILLLVGFSAVHWLDHAADGHGHAESDGDTHFGGFFDWLNTGRVPLLVLIMLALGAFAALGFVLEAFARALLMPLPALIAAPIAALAAVPVVRAGSRMIARVVPRDETYAVDAADFVGRTAEVTMGPLDEGLPGRVKLRDAHGNWHFPRARAAKGQGPMAVGSTVLLVDRDDAAFLAIPAPTDLVNER
jgi:membrane protein implicated in regulation of membrane protease activity